MKEKETFKFLDYDPNYKVYQCFACLKRQRNRRGRNNTKIGNNSADNLRTNLGCNEFNDFTLRNSNEKCVFFVLFSFANPIRQKNFN